MGGPELPFAGRQHRRQTAWATQGEERNRFAVSSPRNSTGNSEGFESFVRRFIKSHEESVRGREICTQDCEDLERDAPRVEPVEETLDPDSKKCLDIKEGS